MAAFPLIRQTPGCIFLQPGVCFPKLRDFYRIDKKAV